MINENTLSKLNDIGFGADIDGLESYIIDFKQANLVSNLRNYEYRYNSLVDILEEIKPNSLAFSEKTSLNTLDFDKYDTLFESYNNVEPELAYGIKSVAVNNLKANIDCEDDKTVDIMAMTNVEGIDISCIYLHGYLYRIYAIGEYTKHINLTPLIKDNIASYIEDFENYELIELRARLTIFKNSEALRDSLNIPCSIMRCLRTKTYLKELQVVFNDMFIDCELDEMPYNNHWDKIEYMRDLGLSVPHHALIRNVDRDTIEQAIIDLDKYFIDISNTSGIVYEYSGIQIQFNSIYDITSLINKLIYISDNADNLDKFSSTVKSISTTYDGEKLIQNLNIIPVKCNDRLLINSIKLNDIYDLEKYDITIGKKVTFFVVEGKAILCD